MELVNVDDWLVATLVVPTDDTGVEERMEDDGDDGKPDVTAIEPPVEEEVFGAVELPG